MRSYKRAIIFSLLAFLFFAGTAEGRRYNAGEERSFLHRQKKALEDAEDFFLKGDYKNAVKVCEDILYLGKRYSAGKRYSDDLFYVAGISYLKLNEPERAKYYLNKVVSQHKNSNLYDEAYLALAEAFFLSEDYTVKASSYPGKTLNSACLRQHCHEEIDD